MLAISLYLLAGFVALYFGSSWLVGGSAALAQRLGMSPLVAGLTVVAFGTSAPELVVSWTAALKGQGDIAIGNAVGSNILNVALILGLTALITPLKVRRQILVFDLPVMLGATLLFCFFFRDQRIERWDACAFLAAMVAYVAATVVIARRAPSPVLAAGFEEEIEPPTGAAWKDVVAIVCGLTALIFGSKWFVTGAVEIARLLGVGEAVIGLTVVAIGTSLPELATSLTAAFRRHADIAIGNVVGSNIFNLLAILGIPGAVAGPLIAHGVGVVDVVTMTATSLALAPMAWRGLLIRRWQGALLLATYIGYVIHLLPKPAAL